MPAKSRFPLEALQALEALSELTRGEVRYRAQSAFIPCVNHRAFARVRWSPATTARRTRTGTKGHIEAVTFNGNPYANGFAVTPGTLNCTCDPTLIDAFTLLAIDPDADHDFALLPTMSPQIDAAQ
jgi:hypothetical protein